MSDDGGSGSDGGGDCGSGYDSGYDCGSDADCDYDSDYASDDGPERAAGGRSVAGPRALLVWAAVLSALSAWTWLGVIACPEDAAPILVLGVFLLSHLHRTQRRWTRRARAHPPARFDQAIGLGVFIGLASGVAFAVLR